MYDQFLDLNFIEELASELRKHSDNQTNRINIEQILNRLGFVAYGTEFEDKKILSKVLCNKDKKEIYVIDDPYESQRFILAHEIGNMVLNYTVGEVINKITYKENPKYSDMHSAIRKSNANSFAVALLMPKEESVKIWNSLNNIESFKISCQFDNFLIFLKLKKPINTDLLK